MTRSKTALIDSGYWIALFDPRDPYHGAARDIAELLDDVQIVVPWPTMYEFVNTRFIRNPLATSRFNSVLRKPAAVLLDDSGYKADALSATLSAVNAGRAYSLVDNVLRAMLCDVSLRLSYFYSFNAADFNDVCATHHVEIFPGPH